MRTVQGFAVKPRSAIRRGIFPAPETGIVGIGGGGVKVVKLVNRNAHPVNIAGLGQGENQWRQKKRTQTILIPLLLKVVERIGKI